MEMLIKKYKSGLLKELMCKVKKDAREESKKRMKVRPDNLLYVGDLCKCKRKRDMSRGSVDNGSIAVIPSVVVGRFVGSGLSHLLCEYYDAKNEISLEKEVGDYVVRGRYDCRVDDQIIEVKFSGWSSNAMDHHLMQCKIYCWLYDVDNVLLWVFSPKGIKEYVVEAEFDDEDILRFVDEYKCPMWKWECKYCTFSGGCDESV